MMWRISGVLPKLNWSSWGASGLPNRRVGVWAEKIVWRITSTATPDSSIGAPNRRLLSWHLQQCWCALNVAIGSLGDEHISVLCWGVLGWLSSDSLTAARLIHRGSISNWLSWRVVVWFRQMSVVLLLDICVDLESIVEQFWILFLAWLFDWNSSHAQ